jgi:non-heme chloroperoxidase
LNEPVLLRHHPSFIYRAIYSASQEPHLRDKIWLNGCLGKKMTVIVKMMALVLILLGPVEAAPLLGKLPEQFDSLGPTVQKIKTADGRQIHYIDDGPENGVPVIFTGGLGTSVRAIRLLDFLRSLRLQLQLRLITVERNGFGQTDFDPALDMTDYAEDVELVLEKLDIDTFILFGISGGGPYTAKLAARNEHRLLSVHMAATSPIIGQPAWCENNGGISGYRDLLAYPMQFFGFPSDSTLHKVEGFQDTAYDEAARAHNLRGQAAGPEPLDHESMLYCKEGPIDTSGVTADVYVYRGLADGLLKAEKSDQWQTSYPKAEVILREYPGEGHDVQYRHLDQILLDMAGFGAQLLVCEAGVNDLIAPSQLKAALADGASLGLCIWQ